MNEKADSILCWNCANFIPKNSDNYVPYRYICKKCLDAEKQNNIAYSRIKSKKKYIMVENYD